MDNKNCIIIAAGGTGGHVLPSIGLANYLMKDYDIEIFTDERGIKYLNNHKNIKIKKIISSRVFSKNIIYFVIGIVKVFLSIIFSIILLIKRKPKLIIGMGGYSSFPVCLSGFFLKIPIFIYENNLVIGRANKILLPFSKKILVSTNSIQGIDNKYKNKISHIGFLLRDNILGAKNTNLEVTKININNFADNVIPATAEATFNIRFNNKHSSKSLKQRINKFLIKINKKNKSKFKIDYRVSGEAF